MSRNKQQSTKPDLNSRFTHFFSRKWVVAGLLVIIGITYISNYSAIFDKKLDMGGDNIFYYTLGKTLADGHGYTDQMGFTEKPHSHFPPGYPVFVACIMQFFPENITAQKAANGILFFLSIVLLFFISKRLTGNYLIGFFACMLCCLHGELLRWATIIMSEPLYMFVMMLILFFALEYIKPYYLPDKRYTTYISVVCLTLLTGYAWLVRTMGTSMALSLLLWFGLLLVREVILLCKKTQTEEKQLHKRACLRYGLALILVFGGFFGTKTAWNIRNTNLGIGTNAYESNFMMKMDGKKMETTADWTERIKTNVCNFTTRWVPQSMFFSEVNMAQKVTAGEWLRGILMLALMLWGVFGLRNGKLLLFFYVAATMAVLILYPEQYGGSRYYVPIIPLLIMLMLNGIAEAAKLLCRLVSKNKSRTSYYLWTSVAVGIFALLLMPAYTNGQKQYRNMTKLKTWKSGAPAMSHYIQACEWCSTNLPDNARVICRKPELFYIYSDYHHAESFPWYATPDEIMEMLRKKQVTHIILDSWFKHAYTTLYPAIMAHPNCFQIVRQIGEPNAQLRLNPTYVVLFTDRGDNLQ